MQKILIASIFLFSFSFVSKTSFAHCEVPCGIYDDSVRIKLIYEHITTIEKAIMNINALSKEAKPNYNQLVRWINNKEEHATKLQEIVSQYFLHQRIKPVDNNDAHSYGHYIQKLDLLHHLSVMAMQAKQATDELLPNQMRATVRSFEKAYFEHTH